MRLYYGGAMYTTHFSHHEPIATFPTKTGRRTLLLLGCAAFVIVSAVLLWIGVANFVNGQVGRPIAWLGVIVGPVGLIFFGFIGINILTKTFGSQGDTGLVLSPVGFTDNTQLSGPKTVIPWSFIAQYDATDFQGQPMIIMRLQQPEAYRHALGASKLKQWLFKTNTSMMKGPVHMIVLKHLQAPEHEIIAAIQHFSGLPPGYHPQVPNN